MVQIKNTVYTGSKKRESLYDLTIPEKFNGDLILFIHGYMGFKDWGAWNLMEQAFVNQDFGFCCLDCDKLTCGGKFPCSYGP